MADAVTAILTQRNGECKEYREALTKETNQEGGKLDVLIKSLTKIQKDVNDSLTELVEEERGHSKGTANSQKHDQDDNLDDGDDDDDEDDDDDSNQANVSNTNGNDSGPVNKKLKV